MNVRKFYCPTPSRFSGITQNVITIGVGRSKMQFINFTHFQISCPNRSDFKVGCYYKTKIEFDCASNDMHCCGLEQHLILTNYSWRLFLRLIFNSIYPGPTTIETHRLCCLTYLNMSPKWCTCATSPQLWEVPAILIWTYQVCFILGTEFNKMASWLRDVRFTRLSMGINSTCFEVTIKFYLIKKIVKRCL